MAEEVDRYEKVKMLLQSCQAQAIESMADNSTHSTNGSANCGGNAMFSMTSGNDSSVDSPMSAAYASTFTATPHTSSSQKSRVDRHINGQRQGQGQEKPVHDSWKTVFGRSSQPSPLISNGGSRGGDGVLLLQEEGVAMSTSTSTLLRPSLPNHTHSHEGQASTFNYNHDVDDDDNNDDSLLYARSLGDYPIN